MKKSASLMFEPERRIRIALLKRRMSAQELAKRIGLSYGSTKNLILGAQCSTRTKQQVTNALGTDEIWPGIQVTERRITLPAGLEIELANEAEAISAEKDFASFIRRTGRKISFIKPTPATFGVGETTNLSARRAAKRTPTRPAAKASESAAAY